MGQGTNRNTAQSDYKFAVLHRIDYIGKVPGQGKGEKQWQD